MCCNTNYYGDKHYLELVAWHCPRKHIIIYMPFCNIMLMFHIKLPSYSLFVIMISLCILAHAIRVLFLRCNHGFFSIKNYLMQFVAPCMSIAIANVIVTGWVHTMVHNCLLRLLAVCFTSILVTIIFTSLIGTSKTEREYIRKKIHI